MAEDQLLAEVADLARRWAAELDADDSSPVFPQTDTPGHPLYLFSLTRPWRPQDCDCGASQVAMVAHYERCAARR